MIRGECGQKNGMYRYNYKKAKNPKKIHTIMSTYHMLTNTQDKTGGWKKEWEKEWYM